MNNSVFISYRRTASAYLALAVYQDLHANGIDGFYDIESIDAGKFDTIILNQIAARPYFMPILTPGTLERCQTPGDWVLREMEHALKLERVFVPLYTPEFKMAELDQYLPAALAAALRGYNMVELPQRWFKYAMQELRTRFLKPIDLPLTSTPRSEVAAIARQQAQIAAQPPVTEKQLSAQEYFERAYARSKTDYDGQIADYSEALRLVPNDAGAYNNRGIARKNKGDYDGAIADYSEALRLVPNDAGAYNNRGIARRNKGDYDSAIADYNEALRLDPKNTNAYVGRGNARDDKGDHEGAIADYNEALRFDPKNILAYNNRGAARQLKGDKQGAIADYEQALKLDPNNTAAKDNLARLKGKR